MLALSRLVRLDQRQRLTDCATATQGPVASAAIAAWVGLLSSSSADFRVRHDEPTAWQPPQRVPAVLQQTHGRVK